MGYGYLISIDKLKLSKNNNSNSSLFPKNNL